MRARLLDVLLVLAVASIVAGIVLLTGLAGGLIAGGVGAVGLAYALAPAGGEQS